eukprot:TRINITY_DN15343_c0_g1_i1.p1 TRINITY_DN15343_c0_g1~~TRINITY_DN15343_c0_g1_i1.p1  ORF type:complete len:214 (-),score=37.10 TRINITY_DN15343_c0_g1_i1:57-698(-)
MATEEPFKLFVGRLPLDIRESEVEYVFKTYGKVVEVKVHEKVGESGQRSAFVWYEDREDAQDAVESLHNIYKFRYDSKSPVLVDWGRKPTLDSPDEFQHGHNGLIGMSKVVRGNKLYVANLPSDVTEMSLRYVFCNYGIVDGVFILHGARRVGGTTSAFVKYSKEEDAEKAVLAMRQGYEIKPGQGSIVVKFANRQDCPARRSRKRSRSSHPN